MNILDTGNLSDDIEKRKIFLGDYSGFQRYDVYKYPFAKKIETEMRNAFWNPEEISLNTDRMLFQELPEGIKEILTYNLMFQTVMDSTQSRGLDAVMAELTTSPEWEAVFRTQAYFEQIHSLSYSHIIREMYPDATETFNRIGEMSEIHDRVNDEVALYNYLISDEYKALSDDKKREAILEMIVRIYALEGIKFYVSFLVTYTINNSYKNAIQGFTRIIKLINFDEDKHVSVFGGLLNILRRVDSEGFVDLIRSPEYSEMCKDIMSDVRNGELEWAKFLTSISRIPSLTNKVFTNFIDYYVSKRLNAIKVEGVNPIAADDTVNFFEIYKDIDKDNVAGQEAEKLSYNIGILRNDIPEGKFDFEFGDKV